MAGSSSSWFRAQRLGRYQIRGELGQGAFGSVFHAFDPQLNREVAIKVLVREDARSTKRFAREVQAAAKLRHPNIVAVHESGEFQGRPFLVMEYVDGDDLEALATAERRLSVSRAVEIVRDAARAIDHAHEQEVLHRDIKPQNILVDRNGQAQVVDFGLASLRDAQTERLTHTGLPLGTPAFMAPEQMRGEKVDEQADVFGLGATLYFALCGRPPRGEGVSPFASAAGGRIDPPSKVDPRVPKALDVICLEALHDEPWERHEGAGELADALDRFLAGDAPSRPRRRRRGGIGAAALPLLVAAIAVLGGLLALLVSRKSTPTTETPTTTETPVAATTTPTADAKAEGLLSEGLAAARRLESTAAVAELLRQAEEAAGGEALKERIRLARIRHDFNRARHAAVLARSTELAARPGAVGLEVRLMRAITLFRQERKTEGRALAQRLVEDDPNGSFGLTAQGYIAMMVESDHTTALQRAAAALERAPENHYARLQKALAYTNMGRHDEALELYRAAASSARRDDVHGYLGMAVTLLNKRTRKSDPTDPIDRAIRTAFELMGPNVTGVALRTRGHARLFTGRVAESIPDLERAHQLRPADAPILMLLGMALDRQELHDRARDAFVKAYSTDSAGCRKMLNTTQPMSLRLRMALDMQRPARTPPEITNVMKTYVADRLRRLPEAARPIVKRAYELMRLGYPWSRIAPEFEAAHKAAPDEPELARLEAEAALGRGNDRRALSLIRKARRGGLADLSLDYLEGEAYLRAASRTRGLELFTRVAKANPQGVLGRSAQAFLLWQHDKLDEARKVLKPLVEASPPHIPSVVLLAVIERQSQRFGAARTIATEAAARLGFLDPWVVGQAALSNLAHAVRKSKKRKEVRQAFQFVANTMLATDEPTLKLMGANYACEVAASNPDDPWVAAADRWLYELRKQRRGSPEPHLMSGWLDLLRDKPAREVLAHWAEARRVGEGALPATLTKAFQRKFGRKPF